MIRADVAGRVPLILTLLWIVGIVVSFPGPAQALKNVNAADPPFNARCDGVANDTIAVEAAARAVAAGGGGTVTFPVGTCRLRAASWDHLCGVTFTGQGIGKTVLQRLGPVGELNALVMNFTGSTTKVGIRDLSIDLNGVGTFGGVQFQGVNGLRVDMGDVWVP